MFNKNQVVKKNKIILYITYTILLAFVVFNYEKVFSTVVYLLSLATPLYIAIVIAFLLNLGMKKIEVLVSKKIEKRKLCRGISIAITLFIALILLLLFISFIIPRLAESIRIIITNIFNYSNQLVTLINETLQSLNIHYIIDYNFIQNFITSLDLNSFLLQGQDSLGQAGLQLIFQSIGIVSVVINGIMSFIMAIYLLANKEAHITQLKKIITFFFGYKNSSVIFDIGAEANHYFNGFISGQLLDCCILMGMMYIGFLLLGLPFPELTAFIVGFTALVPMFGGYVGFFIDFVLVLAIAPSQAFLFIIAFVIIQQLEASLVYPHVVGNAVGISGFYVLLALIIFGNLFGFIGMLIAVPCMALIYAVGSRIINIGLYRRRLEVTQNGVTKIEDIDDDIPYTYKGH